MAKIKSHPIQKMHLMKDCRVNLKRLDRKTIERYLDPSTITYDISVKIVKNTMKMDKTIIKGTDKTFNIDIKVNAESILIKPTTIVVNEPASSRILRPRAAVSISHSEKLKNNSKSCLTVVKTQPKSTSKMIDDAWRQCKSNNVRDGNTIRLKDIVIAKLKGHAPWPAVVNDFVNKSRVLVEFFGADKSQKFGFVGVDEITPFMHSSNVIRVILLTLKRDIAMFTKGIREAELICGVPSHASITNDM